MKLQLHIFLLSTLIALPTVSSAQSPSEYVGHYTFPKGSKEFPHFFQIDLNEDTANAGSLIALLIFTPITRKDIESHCETKEISLNGDSLRFSANCSFNERFEFVGRFVRKPKFHDEDYLIPVLEGTLAHFTDNRLLAKKKVAFLYDPPGD